MLRTFIQFTSLTTTFVATIFWIKGSAFLSIRNMVVLSTSYFDGNPARLPYMAEQKVDSLIAGLLLALSFILQTGNALWPMSFNDFGINPIGVMLSLFFTAVLALLCYFISEHLRRRYIMQAKALGVVKPE